MTWCLADHRGKGGRRLQSSTSAPPALARHVDWNEIRRGVGFGGGQGFAAVAGLRDHGDRMLVYDHRPGVLHVLAQQQQVVVQGEHYALQPGAVAQDHDNRDAASRVEA